MEDINLKDIQLLAEFDGYVQSPTNEYLWRKGFYQKVVNTPHNSKVQLPGGPLIDIGAVTDKGATRLSSLKYRESFDALIPLIKKCKIISSDKSFKNNGYHFDIMYNMILERMTTLKSEEVYLAVVMFVEIYNRYINDTI